MRHVILATLLAACSLAADWPQLLGPNRASTSAETGLIASFGAKGPAVAWKREVGDGYASVAVAGGKLVLFHRVGDNETVECLAADTGKPIWKKSYPTSYSDALNKGDGPRSTPTIAGDNVYSFGPDGTLSCWAMKDGEKRWSKNLVKAYDVPGSFFGVGSTPLVEGKRVLVNVGGEKAGVVAFDTASGKELWKASTDGASYSSPAAASLAGRRQAVFFTRNGLLCVAPDTGKVLASMRWRARINESVNAATPVILPGDHVFLSTSYNTGAILLKFTKEGTETVWKNDTSLTCHFNTPVAVGEQLYGVHGRQEGGAKLRCIDWKTGKVRWTESGFGCGSIIHADGKLWLMSEKGELILAKPNADKFEVLSRAKVLTGPVRAHLALSGGLLYCRDNKQLIAWKVKK
jgi:outer membrane protein assembly factor BamB